MKKLQKIFAMLLAVIMMMGLSTTAFAKEVINGNDWYGDQVAVDVVAGTDGYTYMSLFRKYVHGYEFGGHFLGDGEGPQTFVVIDTVEHDGTTWTPSGLYVPNESNYEVAYCCDVETMIVDGTYYKRLNLEDSEYYGEEAAARIRAIVTNSYPYVSLEEMKADLAADDFAYANELTRNEILAAVQTAIWACANGDGEPMRYVKSYKVSDNLQWGYPMHDTSNESGLDVSGNRVFETYEEVGTRIDSLVDYLLAQGQTYAEKNQVIISELKIEGAAPVIGKGGAYQVALQVSLNNSGSSDEDAIAINIYVNDELVKTEEVILGTEIYDLTVEAEADDVIKAEVAGIQNLPYGVYFYAPKPADVDPDGDKPELPDGIETAREVSQNLVAAAQGATPIHDSESLTLNVEPPVTADLQLQKVDESGKALTGAEFALYVKTAETAIKVDTYVVDENGRLTIGNLLPNSYELRETKAPAGYILPSAPITFTVTSDGIIESEAVEEGVLTVVNELIPAPETTEVYVAKQWVGDTAETRPASVDVQLLRNGVVYDTVTLTANNGWAARWFNLDIDATWTVAEASVPAGYTASVAQNGNSFVITNTFGVELPEPPVPLQPSVPTQDDFFIDEEDVPLADVPATGDPLTVMAAMSALSAAGVYFTRKKRDEE